MHSRRHIYQGQFAFKTEVSRSIVDNEAVIHTLIGSRYMFFVSRLDRIRVKSSEK